jgi:hypothetical protein
MNKTIKSTSNPLDLLNSRLPVSIVKLQKFMTNPPRYRIVFANGSHTDFLTVDKLTSPYHVMLAFIDSVCAVVRPDAKSWPDVLNYLLTNALEIIPISREVLITFIIDIFKKAKRNDIDKVMNAVVYDDMDKRFYFKLKVLERILQSQGLNVTTRKLSKVLKEEFGLCRTRKTTWRTGTQSVWFVDYANFQKLLDRGGEKTTI